MQWRRDLVPFCISLYICDFVTPITKLLAPTKYCLIASHDSSRNGSNNSPFIQGIIFLHIQ